MIWVSTGMAYIIYARYRCRYIWYIWYISAINSLTCIVCAGKDRKAAHIRAQANDGAWGWTGASEALQRGAHQIHSRTRAEQWRFRESKAVSVWLFGVHRMKCCKYSSCFSVIVLLRRTSSFVTLVKRLRLLSISTKKHFVSVVDDIL